MEAQTNFQVVFKSKPGINSEPKEENFTIEKTTYPTIPAQKDYVIVENIYISVDPAQRCQMNDETGVAYMEPWVIGERINGLGGVGRVIESNSDEYTVGEYFSGNLHWPWSNYFLVNIAKDGRYYRKIDEKIVKHDLTLPLSLFGLVGLTPIVGLLNLGNIKEDGAQTLMVSGAAGACGSLAGQIGRLLGCKRVIGICGTDDKCQWITNDLGFDQAINYKTENVRDKLRAFCPNGIDVYFDNVGGLISQEVLKQMNRDSSCAICGQISSYNKDMTYPDPLPKELNDKLLNDNITRKTFLVLDYENQYEKCLQMLQDWYFDNKIKVFVTEENGLENTGKAFVSMMKGGNTGKQVIKVV